MGMNFTPEQQKVIELHNSNILVSAAAGSGKTAVLVERIIRMICEGEHPADIDRLLIVTFTNAAAAEMRERIAGGSDPQPGSPPDWKRIRGTTISRSSPPCYTMPRSPRSTASACS